MKRMACVAFAVCGCVSSVERAPGVDKSMRLETASMMREALQVNEEYEKTLIHYLNFDRASAAQVLTEAWRRSGLRWGPADARTNQQIGSIPVRAMMGDVHAGEAMMVLQSMFEMNAVPMELGPSVLGVYVRLVDAGDAKEALPAAPPRPRHNDYRQPAAGYRTYDPYSPFLR